MDSSSSNNGVRLQEQFMSCHNNWLVQQQDDLYDLRGAVSITGDSILNQAHLRPLINRFMEHLQEYMDRRSDLSLMDTQAWYSSLEKSSPWLGGERPTMCIRLVNSIYDIELGSSVPEHMMEAVRNGNLGLLSAYQLNLIHKLKSKTVLQEDILSEQMTLLQASIGEKRSTKIARGSSSSGAIGKWKKEREGYVEDMWKIMNEADKLRFYTLKCLIQTLTPCQAVDLLITSINLNLNLSQYLHHQ